MHFTCESIDGFSKSGFLKFTIILQGTLGLVALVSVIITHRSTLRTAIIDRPFKEYLIACYIILIIQSLCLFILQYTLLVVHLVSPPCEAVVPALLCFSLRITSTIGIAGIPFQNLSITLYRALTYSRSTMSKRKSLWLARSIIISALLLTIGLNIWKHEDIDFSGFTPYCIGNTQSMKSKLEIEAAICSVCEIVALLVSTLTYRLQNKNARKRFDLNSRLQTRQSQRSFVVLIPYTILNSLSFWSFAIITSVFRNVFRDLAEPEYSAASGLVFLNMYFATGAPWFLYYLIRREEAKRSRGTSALLETEKKNAERIYFDMARIQWQCPDDEDV